MVTDTTTRGTFVLAVLLGAAGVVGAQVGAPLRPEAFRLAAAPAALQAGLREDPFVYFRILNMEWAARVCDAFREDLPALPTAILHGDAHLEQYALTALVPKLLARVEGPSPAPGDDVLLEAKQLSRLEGVPCVQVPLSGEAFRVIAAAEQIGRLRHGVLLVAPRREDQGPQVRDWWVRTWDDTYMEMAIADLDSPDELAEVVHDVGAQLGSANLRQSIPLLEAQLRRAEIATVRRLDPRIRATARRLVDELLAGWEEWRAAR